MTTLDHHYSNITTAWWNLSVAESESFQRLLAAAKYRAAGVDPPTMCDATTGLVSRQVLGRFAR